MSRRTDQVKSGYASLDDADREDVKNFIREFDDAGPYTKLLLKENLNKALNKLGIGPRDNNICGCCGKSQ